MSLPQKNLRSWFLVNGSFALLVASTAALKQLDEPMIFLPTFLNVVVGLTMVNSLLLLSLFSLGKNILPQMSWGMKVLDVLYDGAMLTVLCVCFPWYTWGMYFVVAVLSAFLLCQASVVKSES